VRLLSAFVEPPLEVTILWAIIIMLVLSPVLQKYLRKRTSKRLLEGRRSGGSPGLCLVSRHGFQESGITCPRCGLLAVEPGDWRQVHVRNRVSRGPVGQVLEEWTEEGAPCPHCGAYLEATPDSDIDPIEFAQDYDKGIYHKFVRPPGHVPPRQKTSERGVLLGDWVVIRDYDGDTREVLIQIDGEERNLEGAEGRVVQLSGDTADVLFISGKDRCQANIPLKNLRPMLFESFRSGVRVKGTKQPVFGQTGTVLSLVCSGRTEDIGKIEVSLDDGRTVVHNCDKFTIIAE